MAEELNLLREALQATPEPVGEPFGWWFTEDPECHWCRGDGMDPYTDYLLPCPYCQGEQRP